MRLDPFTPTRNSKKVVPESELEVYIIAKGHCFRRRQEVQEHFLEVGVAQTEWVKLAKGANRIVFEWNNFLEE